VNDLLIGNNSSTEVNQIGVPFILMSKASGSALNAWDWNNLHCSKLSASHEKPRSCLTFMEKKKIMKQIGRITSQLSRLRFDYIGSIFEEEGTYKIKNCLSSAFSLYGRDKFRENIDRGPFTHEKEYYESLVSAFLLHVESLPLEHHIFLAPVPTPDEYNTYDDYRSATDRWNDFVTVGSKIDSGKNRLDYFIIGRLLQNMIPSLAKISDFKSSDDSAGFPLSHPDLSLSNIFVDDDCNITCVIDWAFTTSVPFAALLMTPGLPHPRDGMTSSLTTAFRNGFEEDQHSCSKTYKIETGSPYTMWDQCRNIWLFTRLINMDSLQDVRHFTQLYTSISGEADINVPILLKRIKTQGEFPRKALSLTADDQPSSDIEREEMEYFSHVGLKRLALSRKLTLVSNMSEGFLANGRLWRWLAKAVGSEDD